MRIAATSVLIAILVTLAYTAGRGGQPPFFVAICSFVCGVVATIAVSLWCVITGQIRAEKSNYTQRWDI